LKINNSATASSTQLFLTFSNSPQNLRFPNQKKCERSADKKARKVTVKYLNFPRQRRENCPTTAKINPSTIAKI